MDAAVKLRGHHLLCMLPYIGRGYTSSFTKNFDELVERLNKGACVELVMGADDICAAFHGENGDAQCEKVEIDLSLMQHGTIMPKLPEVYNPAHDCLGKRAAVRDNAALQDVGAALGRPLVAGDILAFTPEITRSLREKFTSGSIRQACTGCEWFDICSGIAACGFRGVKLHPHKEQ